MLLKIWKVIQFKYLVTSALTYVNNIPHLGTLIPLISADAYSRFLKLKGEKCIYISGADEYGTPATVQAEKEGITPAELADKYSALQRKLFIDGLKMEFDNYGRTTVPEHIKITQSIYEKIRKNGYVYKKEIEQLYCEKCRRFLPDRYVEGICPICGAEGARGDQCDACGKLLDPTDLREPYCVICKGAPARKKSTHIFFALSKFSDKLQTWIEKNEHWSARVRNFALSWLREGLKDRCISRDLEWGVPIPDLPGKVFYVWFDAPIGYITACKEIGKENWWKEKDVRIVHFLGKDNILFHAIFFPAMLLAAGGYALPYQVPSNEYLNYEGGKFSKSKNRGIFVEDALQILPADYWRYYLLATRPEKQDTDFTWRDFQEKINNDLNDALGNFVHRTLVFTAKFFDGRVPKADADEKVLAQVKEKAEKAAQLLGDFKIKEALQEIISIARLGNEYLSAEEPWKNKARQPAVIFACLQICKALGTYLEPFIPATADRIKEYLKIKKTDWAGALEELKPGHKIGEPAPLFRKIENKEIKEWENKFKGR